MIFLQVFFQITFILIILIIGYFSGRWLCNIAPEEIKQGRKWAKNLIKVFIGLVITSMGGVFFFSWTNILFVMDFLLFLVMMMVGIILYK